MSLRSAYIAVFGTGGSGRETASYVLDLMYANGLRHIKENEHLIFTHNNPEEQTQTIWGYPVVPLDQVDLNKYAVSIAVGSPQTREKICNDLGKEARYTNVIHPSAYIGQNVKIEEGVIIAPGCILTCDIQLGRQVHLNLHTTIAHDTVLGDFVTTAPGVKVSGNCHLEARTYLGTNAGLRQGISVKEDSIVGMGASVVKNIEEAGVYAGVPAKLIKSL